MQLKKDQEILNDGNFSIRPANGDVLICDKLFGKQEGEKRHV